VRVHNVNERIEDGFLNNALLVRVRGELVEFDRCLDLFPERCHQLYVDVGFYQGIADLLDHAIEGLLIEGGGAGEVGDGGVDTPPQIRENHVSGVV
jgi:L-asparaginase/Glu-tRNA(Gln) amidotransferase subunit D